MNIKITKLFLACLFTGFSFANEVNKPQDELIYSVNLTKHEYETVHSILKEYFGNFPTDSKRKITYTEKEKSYSLEIILAKRKLKMKYKGNNLSGKKNKILRYAISNDPDSKIRIIKSKIEEIKLRIKKNKEV